MMRRTALLALTLSLIACTTPAPAQRPDNFWSGRLALQVFSDPPQSYHAGFELQGSLQEGELLLLSPVGSVLARLQWNPQQAILERGNERWQHASVDQLTRQLIPAPVPMATLLAWLQGQRTPDPNWQADLSEHAQGRIRAQRLQPLPAAELRLALDR
jgi:outer membrane lipoprotein LolB